MWPFTETYDPSEKREHLRDRYYKADGDGQTAWMHERAAGFHGNMASDHKSMMADSVTPGEPATVAR